MSNVVTPFKQSEQNFKDTIQQNLDDDSILDEIKLKLESSDKKITINLRGFKFELFVKSFSKHPTSRLAKLSIMILNSNGKPFNRDDLLELCDYYELDKMEFYFNKDPFILNKILNLYTENYQKIHVEEGVCINYLNTELDYWGFENKFQDIIDKCCQVHLYNRKCFIDGEIEKEEKLIKQVEFKHEFKYFFPKLREKLFNYVEYSNNSIIGRVSISFY
jgi:hypothetical protein